MCNILAPCDSYILEGHARAEAQDPCVGIVIKRRSAGNLAKSHAGYAGVRVAEVRVIEDIESIHPQFPADPFSEPELLDNRAVEHQVARAVDRTVARQLAE